MDSITKTKKQKQKLYLRKKNKKQSRQDLTISVLGDFADPLSWNFISAKNRNNQAINYGDIADQRISKSDYLAPTPNHLHPKRDSQSFPFLGVHLLTKNLNG